MTPDPVRVATRGSLLARTQAEQAIGLLAAAAPPTRFELAIVRTAGDRGQRDVTGAFVREIQQAVLAGEADLAVHSLKDLPVEPSPGLTIAAIPPRADPRDVLMTRGPGLADLPAGARVGTGSPRRAAQLWRMRSDLSVEPLVGNVDTRIGKLAAGHYDGIVLAAAALERLGHAPAIACGRLAHDGACLAVHALPLDAMLPAPGQGALAIECRADRADMLELARRVDHDPTRLAVAAERALLAALGGGCRAPVGAHAAVEGGACRLRGFHSAQDGSRSARAEAEGLAAGGEALASSLAARLRHRLGLPLAGLRVAVTRPRDQAGPVLERLEALGAEAICVPAIEIAPPEDWSGLDALLRGLRERDWVVFTSANGVRFAAERARAIGVSLPAEAPPRLAAVGPATARALEAAWRMPDAMPEAYLSAAVAGALGEVAGRRVALARADIARPELPDMLVRRGARVEAAVAYRVRAIEESGALVDLAGPPDIVALGSPSAARGLLGLLQGLGRDDWFHRSALACIGPVTADAVRELGATARWVAPVHTWDGLIDAIVGDRRSDER